MSGGIIEHNAPPLPKLPADIWKTNDGIYLGLTPEGGTNQERPLAGKEKKATISRAYEIRTDWRTNGGTNLFRGEGHVATFGPPGVGKSRKLFMPNLFKLRDWSCVVIDPKGELCAHTAVWRASQENHRVYVIDPFRQIEIYYPRLFERNRDLFESKGFNPLAALDPASDFFTDDAKAMAMALIQSDEARDPYWSLAGQALAKGIMMVLRLDRPGQSDSLAVFRDYLGTKPKDFAMLVEADIARFGEKWPAIAASLGEFATHNPEDRELGGIRRTAKAHTDWLDSPLIQKDLAKKNVIDFASLKEVPTTVYLILPPEQLATHGMWLRLMITAALRPLMRSVERSPVPVLFMLDEFAQIGRMAMIENNIAQIRGYGIKLWTAWQDVSQMADLYKDSWKKFMSTSDIKITFTANDIDTREYFSKFSGERLYPHYMHSQSTNKSVSSGFGQGGNLALNLLHNMTNQNVSESASVNESRLSERVVKTYELAALQADEALIFAPRGMMYRAICPQPERLPVVGEAITAARAQIEGTQQRRLV